MASLTRHGSRNNERGTVLVFTALLMVAFLGAGAIAVDAGHLYSARTELQTAADAAALAAAHHVGDQSEATSTAMAYAEANGFGISATVATSDVVVGHWDEDAGQFTPGAYPRNAVEVTAQRNSTRGNAVPYLFARLFGRESGDVTASSIAMLAGGNTGTRFLIDEEMIDSDIPAIEALAAMEGMDSDDMITANDELCADYDARCAHWFLPIPAGSVLTLPTGQVGDEGLFAIQPSSWAYTNYGSPTHQDLLNYNEDSSSWRYDLIDKDDLDPLLGVEPVSNPADYSSFADLNYIHVSPVHKSDISNTTPGVNALGERRGLLAYKIIAVGPDPAGSELPSITIKIVDPAAEGIAIDTTGYWENELGGGGARLVG